MLRGREIDGRRCWTGVLGVPPRCPHGAGLEEFEITEERVDLAAWPGYELIVDGLLVYTFAFGELGDHVVGNAVVGEMGNGEVGAGSQ